MLTLQEMTSDFSFRCNKRYVKLNSTAPCCPEDEKAAQNKLTI